MQKLIADVRKTEQRALKFQNEFDTIARYCIATERELLQLLDELQKQPPDNQNRM